MGDIERKDVDVKVIVMSAAGKVEKTLPYCKKTLPYRSDVVDIDGEKYRVLDVSSGAYKKDGKVYIQHEIIVTQNVEF